MNDKIAVDKSPMCESPFWRQPNFQWNSYFSIKCKNKIFLKMKTSVLKKYYDIPKRPEVVQTALIP